MLALRCPVRHCARPLLPAGRALRCAAGHAFDRARSGYCNLLQPQDRRSRRPGDAKDVVAARRRGFGQQPLQFGEQEIAVAALQPAPAPGDALLDAGCGEGFFLAALARAFTLEGCGVDISSAAADAAARRAPEHLWLVANADRALPFADGAFRFVLSSSGRLQPAEFHRVLRADGALLVAVPAADDLIELRAAVLGRGAQLERAARVRRETAPLFRVERESSVRRRAELDAAALADALRLSYRGARRREQERAAGLVALTVTLAFDLLLLRPLQ